MGEGTSDTADDHRRLILWDVDGTLITTGAVGRMALELAVARVAGIDSDFSPVRMGGKTDPQIALELLAHAGVAHPDAEGHLPAVLTAVEEELAAAAHLLRERGRPLPGIPELLGALAADEAVVQTLLTGNLEANAVVKLAAFGLDAHVRFHLGAYGSDHRDREALVPVAIAKVAAATGWTPHPSQAWVIGDTHRDLACARAGGARCLLVATGAETYDELAALGADAVLPDLSDVDAVLELLRS